MKSKISPLPKDKTKPRHHNTFLVCGVPDSTKVPFKAACAAEALSMRDVLICLARLYASDVPIRRKATAMARRGGHNLE